ncbi:MAG: hypothetical protein WBF05_12490 [Anaerolineales bacterium]
MIRFLIRLYGVLLHPYPRQFHTDFGAEMQSVFAEAATNKIGYKSTLQFLCELGDLPGSLLSVYAAQWFRGGNMSTQNEHISPSTRWQALIGVLPFLAFGIVNMIGKMDQVYDLRVIYTYLAFYILVLSGLLIGWIRGFPLWSYGYLGWSLIFAWWWLIVRINGTYWGYCISMLFWIVVLIALLWTRSLSPIKKIFRDISNDWTRLSLAMYTFIAFVFLIYDENHHPYLLIFMSASTLAIAAGAWFFLRSANLKGRVASILGGFVASNVIGQVCDNTWDAGAYYGLPEGSTPWYMTVFRTFMILSFFAVILLWPAAISLYQRIIRRRTANQ